MKKIYMILCCLIMFCGCSKTKEEDLIKIIEDKISQCKNYEMIANLEIYRNESVFSYSVVSTYEESDKFKVELINKGNNHKQIILKNKELLYVFTPNLNKSFKFQSDWPYNNSQIYLLQPIVADLKNDKKTFLDQKDNNFILTSLVNYPNEKEFKKQKVYFDNKSEIKKVEVLDNEDNVKMSLNIISLEYNKKLESDIFDPQKYKNTTNANTSEVNDVLKLNETVYPMYVPLETYLVSQDVLEIENGERMILTFAGESQFVLIQENISLSENEKYVFGDPYLILDTVGLVTDKSVSWISDGIEYSIISETMPLDELLNVAQSIGVEPVGK